MAGSGKLGLTFAAPVRKVFPVRELVAAIRTQVERAFTDVYVEGEVSNYRPADSGHLYFTLKDGSAQLRVVMWRTQARLLRFKLANGLQVTARGRVTVYDERGDLQFQAEHLEPKGAGSLQAAFEELKAKLASEGLFDPEHKKPIPALPRHIGVVTSPRGAALQDMLNILRRRHETVNVLIYPAQVQGETAASEVSAGVRFLNRFSKVDVIVIARGGGSLEDLFSFNDEGLARTVYGSKIPVISAVGHETDFTICDFVADKRAATPSEAAELVISSKQELADRLLMLHKRAVRAVNYKMLLLHNALTRLSQHSSFARMQDLVARRQQRVDDLVNRIAQAHARNLRGISRRWESLDSRLRHQDLRVRLAEIRRQLGARESELRNAAAKAMSSRKTEAERWSAELGRLGKTILSERRSHLSVLDSKLQALSPTAILARGYALVFDADGHLVKAASQLVAGDEVQTQLAKGRFRSTVQTTDVEDS